MNKWQIRERTEAGRAQTFRQFILFAGALGFTWAVTLFGIGRTSPTDISQFVTNAIQGDLSALTYVQVLVYTVVFLFGLSWGLNALQELELLQDWLKPEYFTTVRRNSIHAGCIFIGILLGLLFGLVPKFLVFIYTFILYSVVDIWLWKIRNDEIRAIIIDNNRTLDRDLQNVLEQNLESMQKDIFTLDIFRQASAILENYYLIRDHYRRVGFQLGVLIIIAISPYMWRLSGHSEMPVDFTPDGITIVGYLVFLFALSLSEVVVYIWRLDMDTRLATLKRRLHEKQ